MSYRLGPIDFDALDQAEEDRKRTNANVARLYIHNLYTLISKELAAESWREISVTGSSGSLSFSILASSSGSSGRRYWASQASVSAELSPSEVAEIKSEIKGDAKPAETSKKAKNS